MSADILVEPYLMAHQLRIGVVAGSTVSPRRAVMTLRPGMRASAHPAGTESAWAYTHVPQENPPGRWAIDGIYRSMESIGERLSGFALGSNGSRRIEGALPSGFSEQLDPGPSRHGALLVNLETAITPNLVGV